ncbi:MAG: hypothetical protein IM526_12830 [Microcystis sp. M38BS1]|uniref:hypothetical protein n=1 Tax=Microcystis sp. M38BS1 TaxID=2771188 RepID=UPI0031FC5C46|nr:hypothetical protein [Microcystis sp. M38BS1]
MSQHSSSREAFLNLEYTKLTGNIKLPDVPIIRPNAHRTEKEYRPTSSDSYEPKRLTILNGDYIVYKNKLYAVDRVWAAKSKRWLGAYCLVDDDQRIEIPDDDPNVKLL